MINKLITIREKKERKELKYAVIQPRVNHTLRTYIFDARYFFIW